MDSNPLDMTPGNEVGLLISQADNSLNVSQYVINSSPIDKDGWSDPKLDTHQSKELLEASQVMLSLPGNYKINTEKSLAPL